MLQGYISCEPVVRIRKEALEGGETEYILCLKTGGGIVRNELEIRISEEEFDAAAGMIGYPLIGKLRRTYQLKEGLKLEVSLVDSGAPTEFMYAEIEYGTEEQARNWTPDKDGLTDYLSEDVSEQPGQSMSDYWRETRWKK